MSDLTDQHKAFLELRRLTEMTGELQEPQIKQLQVWPLVAILNSTKADFTCDFNNNHVEFRVTRASGSEEAPGLYERLNALAEWVKFLLGEWTVSVLGDGVEELYDNRN